MSLLKKFFFIFILFFLSISFLNAEEKVSYIDIDSVLSKSKAGSKLLEAIKKEEELKINEFKLNDDNFKNEEKKILAKKNLISKEEFDKEIRTLQAKFQKYMADNSIYMLIDKKNVFIASVEYDITNNLIELIDNQIKNVEIK